MIHEEDFHAGLKLLDHVRMKALNGKSVKISIGLTYRERTDLSGILSDR